LLAAAVPVSTVPDGSFAISGSICHIMCLNKYLHVLDKMTGKVTNFDTPAILGQYVTQSTVYVGVAPTGEVQDDADQRSARVAG